jgi:hypothetical protein
MKKSPDNFQEDTQNIEKESYSSTPAWVKVSGIIVIVIVLIAIILKFTGEHGPGRHMQFIGNTSSVINNGSVLYGGIH